MDKATWLHEHQIFLEGIYGLLLNKGKEEKGEESI
jgi:hypothetical protein